MQRRIIWRNTMGNRDLYLNKDHLFLSLTPYAVTPFAPLFRITINAKMKNNRLFADEV